MKKPQIPANEVERLNALQSLSILDTPAEERFDRLTRLAKRLFDVPIALVSLVDENRQWFKSRVGLDAQETPREVSFCGHAIHDDDIFMVNDTHEDDRFADNPLVTGHPDIRFYGGCPLRDTNGNRLGTLCIIDTQPRYFEEDDLDALRDLAELAERELVAFQLATLDDLTKISNRRGFVSLAQKSLNICARHAIPATLVYFDVDKFKLINDKFGHTEGDNALQAFAKLMQKAFRDSDVYGRLGGDEFALLLTNTDSHHAQQVISRFKSHLDQLNAKRKVGYQLAYSCGIATTTNDSLTTIENLIISADKRMYKNKTAKQCASS